MPNGLIFHCTECGEPDLVLMDDEDEVTCDCGQVWSRQEDE